ncbi:hypothetical protein T310_6557 [Rasamsonia emersonii CBS 393.64]|uniref:Peptidyl-tRNA hydrolase n=1 Tax=Rasamsonia emersonii (strain ATCC 16479 / CBS 393.64 / IMI 116815) TaxID=1408163 RepID=A0A0F4YMJ9_RASE3|nr:hypothetical protein T310_6557 [Rasamsonia emersonii CBS 393.64]KKA19459.1 hypothetical protein T310_6557 [Rasamsonia emersonii CBS 393.64]
MRLSPLLALLPALAAAQNQIPFGEQIKGWLNKAKAYIPSANPAAPVEEAAEKVVEKTVTPLNLSNWQSILEPSSQPQDWLIFITGGNKTCFGRCGTAEKAFNERVLCSIWAAGTPTIWHLQLPEAQAGEPRPAAPLHIVYLNTTTVTPETIYKIHSEKTYEKDAPYEGALHPLDGWLAKYGLNVPLGYVMYGFSLIPSWLFMIAISFFSRTIMGRRLANPGAIAGRQQQAGGNN